MTRTDVLLLSYLVAIAGCRPSEPRHSSEHADSVVAAPTAAQPSPWLGIIDSPIVQLIDTLRVLRGNFEGGLVLGAFDGDWTIPNAIIANPDSAVAPLLECLGRNDSTGVTWQGDPLPLGGVCYALLSTIIYYEPYDDAEWAREHPNDPDAPWPGHIHGRPVTEGALRAAQEAWRKVIERGMHRFT